MILVYASDAACAPQESFSINEALQRFVADDNEALRLEQTEGDRWQTDAFLQSDSSWDAGQDYETEQQQQLLQQQQLEQEEQDLPPPYDEDEDMQLHSDAVPLHGGLEVTDGVAVEGLNAVLRLREGRTLV